MAKILIGYWTKTGTTEKYAVILGQALSAAGHEVDSTPLAEIVGLGEYDAVVPGAPINDMRPVPELTALDVAIATRLPTSDCSSRICSKGRYDPRQAVSRASRR